MPERPKRHPVQIFAVHAGTAAAERSKFPDAAPPLTPLKPPAAQPPRMSARKRTSFAEFVAHVENAGAARAPSAAAAPPQKRAPVQRPSVHDEPLTVRFGGRTMTIEQAGRWMSTY